MLKKRFNSIVVLLLVFVLVLSACTPVTAPTAAAPAATATTAPPATPTVVNFYTDSDTNISDWMSNVIGPAFEKAYPQYKFKVTIVRGIGNGDADIADRALAALQTNSDPQVEVMELDSAGRPDLIKAGLWQPLNATTVPNSSKLITGLQTTETSMPYRGSQVLLAYNSKNIPEGEVPRTFPDLITWVKAHPGQFVYCRPDKGGSGGNFVVRAIYEVTGKDPTVFKPVPTNGTPDKALSDQLPKAWDLLKSIHSNIYENGSYPAGNNPVLTLLANGSVQMATVWSDQYLQASAKGTLPPSIKVTQFTDLPMPGGYAPFSIPKNAKNLKGAHDFLNFMLTPDEQVSIVKDIGGFPAVDWSKLPKDLQTQFNSIITSTVPSWPGGAWDTLRNKGWYDNVATNIKQGS